MMIPRKQRLAAAKGLAFLEAKYPGCTDKFNLDTLGLSDEDSSPLGQASGKGFQEAVRELNLRMYEITEYGFVPDAETDVGDKRQRRWLAAAYKELILERRAA